MKGINLYKIGLENYKGIEDKNSGSYEYDMICLELINAFNKGELEASFVRDCNSIIKNCVEVRDSKHNILVLVGGRFSSDLEKNIVKDLIKESSVSVFVATDVDCFDMNEREIYMCDYLLHQSPVNLKYKDEKHEMYSYVPEIFYNPAYEVQVPYELRNRQMLFAGSLEGREEKVLRLRDKSNIFIIPKIKLKDGDKCCTYDLRLEYKYYKKLLPLFKETYITVCEDALKLGWVTSRFVEAVSCRVVTSCDPEYDKYEHFFKKEKAGYKSEDFIIPNMVAVMKRIEENRYKFVEIIKEISKKY